MFGRFILRFYKSYIIKMWIYSIIYETFLRKSSNHLVDIADWKHNEFR